MKELVVSICWFLGSIIFTSGIILHIIRLDKPKKNNDIDLDKNKRDIINSRLS